MKRIKTIILFLLLVATFVLNLSVGSSNIGFSKIWQAIFSGDTQDIVYITLFQYRLPKALTAILVGIALSVSGLIMQTVFRNPLAGPYILGVSSGASLGVALVMLGAGSFGLASAVNQLGNGTIIISAVAGAMAVLMLLLVVSFRIRDIMTVLILGILFSSGISAFIGIMQYFSPDSMLKAYVIWTMGSLGAVDMQQLVWLAVSVFAGVLLSLLSSKQLNVMLLGEDYARTSGMNILRFRVLVFTATGLLAGSVTAYCGPIGFIGIMVPHLARLLTKTTNHQTLIFYSSIIGAILMLLSDTVSQMPGYTGVLPINSVTAFLGIPVVIWIVLKNHKFSSSF
ncbi:MAG: FecCD family ABC transporter permease [Salinivirgaceae bacterium]|jgi:iron complex transport system permease protein|nr:iron ABC transporter permease [Bacteroidales bacterium]